MRRYAKLYHNGYRLSVPSAPLIRKLQALRVMGHTNRRISEGAGVGNPQYIGRLCQGDRGSEWVQRQTADRINAYYADNWDVRYIDRSGKWSTNYARKLGWKAPLDWDDIEEGF